MKGTLYDLNGKKKGEIDLPKMFSARIREDIAIKQFEADKFIQPYTHDPRAGRKHSAAGTISHKRHDWKGHYGKGISRVPRKTMWRRGTQFYWIGAEASGTRGGRKVHGPKGIGKEKKLNKKEVQIAMNSAFAATGNSEFIVRRYSSIDKINIKGPVVMESKLENTKTKDIMKALKEIFNDSFSLIVKKREVRAGKGKRRNRKYKSNAGLLLVKSEKERIKVNGIDIKNAKEVSISDLYPLGRLTVYTEKAIEELGGAK